MGSNFMVGGATIMWGCRNQAKMSNHSLVSCLVIKNFYSHGWQIFTPLLQQPC